jgi:TolB-like protein/Tfp pilus assembly protein PilF
MPEASSPRGVFLCYAREDTEAARRIADALRGFGVEVWFDQSELRGGDAWDAKIKSQIRECALFVAIISANTQARGEGYFRREWKLAIERTHDMAAGIPFLIPLVVDQTPESKALVPEEFMRVQWTRLAGGAPTAQFVERVKRMAERPLGPQDDQPRPGAATGAGAGYSSRKPGIPGWAWGVGAGIAIAVAAFLVLSRKAGPPAAPVVAAEAKPAATQPKADDKSIAVLPFANMSDEKGNAFFTDGIQEDILTNLALVHELRVVSRTSVEQYRDTKKPIRQIASELGVSYILEGSVRRSGSKVRVTGQLIHAPTDGHIWAKAYDRDLTDIFSIQSELAQAIATELKAALSPQEKAMIERRPTENAEAYGLYLKARAFDGIEDVDKQQALLERAVAMDPSFARAWGDLADHYAQKAFNFHEGADDLMVKSKAAIEQAVRLAPDDPEVISSLGTYYYYGYRDYARANEQYQRLALERPNDAGLCNSLALILRRQGKWSESLAQSRRAVELDVANTRYLTNMISTLGEARRYDELASAYRRLAVLKPDHFEIGFQIALVSFHATGSTKEAEEFFAHLTPIEASSPEGMDARIAWADSVGDLAELIRLERIHPHSNRTVFEPWEEDVISAQNLFLSGDKAGAIALLGRTPEENARRLEREPKSPRLWLFQGIMEMILGHPEEAVRDGDRATEIIPVSTDAFDGTLYADFNARLLLSCGYKERALKEIDRLLHTPGGIGFFNVYELKRDPRNPLRDDPRMVAILDDPANNAKAF